MLKSFKLAATTLLLLSTACATPEKSPAPNITQECPASVYPPASIANEWEKISASTDEGVYIIRNLRQQIILDNLAEQRAANDALLADN